MSKAIPNLSADEKIFEKTLRDGGGLLGVDYLLIACHGQAGLARPRLSPSILAWSVIRLPAQILFSSHPE